MPPSTLPPTPPTPPTPPSEPTPPTLTNTYHEIGTIFKTVDGRELVVSERSPGIPGRHPRMYTCRFARWDDETNYTHPRAIYADDTPYDRLLQVSGGVPIGHVVSAHGNISTRTLAELHPSFGVHPILNGNTEAIVIIHNGVADLVLPSDPPGTTHRLAFDRYAGGKLFFEGSWQVHRPGWMGTGFHVNLSAHGDIRLLGPGHHVMSWMGTTSGPYHCFTYISGQNGTIARVVNGSIPPGFLDREGHIRADCMGIVMQAPSLAQPELGDIYRTRDNGVARVVGVSEDSFFVEFRGEASTYFGQVCAYSRSVYRQRGEAYYTGPGIPGGKALVAKEGNDTSIFPRVMPAVNQAWKISGDPAYRLIIRRIGRQYIYVDRIREADDRAGAGFTSTRLRYGRCGDFWFIGGCALPTELDAELTAKLSAPRKPLATGQAWLCRNPEFFAVITPDSRTSSRMQDMIRIFHRSPDDFWDGAGCAHACPLAEAKKNGDGTYSPFPSYDPNQIDNPYDLDILWSDSELPGLLLASSTHTEPVGFAHVTIEEYCRAPLWAVGGLRVLPAHWDVATNQPKALLTLNMYECAGCHQSFDRRNDCPSTMNRQTWCTACYAARYMPCASCGETFAVDAAGSHADNCPSCVSRGRVRYFHNYGYRPQPKFHGDDKLQFGVELELGISRNLSQEDASKTIATAGKGLVYCKSDSSIGHGVEMVTHPFSLDWMHANVDLFKEWFAAIKSVGGTATDSCGMHIHTSKVGYDVDPDTVAPRPGVDINRRRRQLGILRTQRLVYANADHVVHFAGRISDHYASLRILPSRPGDSRHHTDHHNNGVNERELYGLANVDNAVKTARYSAMNFTAKTIEFRIFASTTDMERFFARVEFTHALIAYCKTRKLPIKPGFASFMRWVSDNPEKYPNLVKLERDYLTKYSLVSPPPVTAPSSPNMPVMQPPTRSTGPAALSPTWRLVRTASTTSPF